MNFYLIKLILLLKKGSIFVEFQVFFYLISLRRFSKFKYKKQKLFIPFLYFLLYTKKSLILIRHKYKL
jgi:hypothetical protein